MNGVAAIIVLATTTLATSSSRADELLASCALGDSRERLIEVYGIDRTGDTLTVTLRDKPGGRLTPLFQDGEPDDSRGASVRVQCSGNKEKVLVIYGEFYGSGYPRGLVLRYNGEKLQRLEFAERSPAQYLYLGAHDMRLYIPQAYPNREQGWTVYRYDAVQGQSADQEFVVKLPDPDRDLRITLQ